MAKGNGRTPKARAVIPASNKPKALQPAATVSALQGQPVFCFKHAQRNADDRWAFKPSDAQAGGLLTFLCDTAQKTWSDIESERTGGKNRHRKHHNYAVEVLDPNAVKDFQKAKLGDIFGDQEIFRFRLDGLKRLWGFRNGTTFHVVWWDPEHKVYPTEPS